MFTAWPLARESTGRLKKPFWMRGMSKRSAEKNKKNSYFLYSFHFSNFRLFTPFVVIRFRFPLKTTTMRKRTTSSRKVENNEESFSRPTNILMNICTLRGKTPKKMNLSFTKSRYRGNVNVFCFIF